VSSQVSDVSERERKILARLHETFAPLECRLIDESALHAGHAGAASGAGHFRLHIVSDRFEGRNRLSRHRLVYDCLSDMMHTDIHALAVSALAPSEVSARE
jgi:BolA family transcriptional regulator, general stress-responsive regulator